MQEGGRGGGLGPRPRRFGYGGEPVEIPYVCRNGEAEDL